MGKPDERRLTADEGQADKEAYRRRVKATRTILKSYRALNAHCRNTAFEFGKHSDEPSGMCSDEIKRCGATSRRVMRYINKALDAYKAACESSQKPERSRRWRVIRAMYISDTEQSAEDIAETEHIDSRTVYKDINRGVEDLAVLIFGVGGLKI